MDWIAYDTYSLQKQNMLFCKDEYMITPSGGFSECPKQHNSGEPPDVGRHVGGNEATDKHVGFKIKLTCLIVTNTSMRKKVVKRKAR